MELKDFFYVGEYIKDRLYFATVDDGIVPQSNEEYHFFCIDYVLVYENFYNDFGPLNLSMLYRYCVTLSKLLNTNRDKVIVHYTTSNAEKRSNAAFLIASFAIIYLKKNVEEAFAPLVNKHMPPFIPFRDAKINSSSMYNISLKDCLQAIYRAHVLGFFRFDDFNVDEYEHYEKVGGGDMNWIIPQKFLAFSGPQSHVDKTNSQNHTPEYYFSYFKNNRITNVIRLNRKSYDANRFVDSGFQHNDLYFLDGDTPSDSIVDKFFKITENAKGAIAVHCKAGLGRTGSVIACYLMKHYRFSAGEAIAWVRICRPGSIIGIQQPWLHEQNWGMWRDGDNYRKKLYGNANCIPTHKYGVYSIEIHNVEYIESNLRDVLYEPGATNNGLSLSEVVRDIGTINLDDKGDTTKKNNSTIVRNTRSRTNGTQGDELYQKNDSAIGRNTRSRTNGTQGDQLYQIKASRKQSPNRASFMPSIGAPPVSKGRNSCPKPKGSTPVTRIYNIPIELQKPAYRFRSKISSTFSQPTENGDANRGLYSTVKNRLRRKENLQ